MADITLGSGFIYVVELPSNGTIPADNAIETTANQFGYTKGGATLSYETEFQEVEDDNGQVKEQFLSTDKCTFKCGAYMGSLADVVRICPTASSATSSGTTTVSLGGVGNDNNKKYVIRFKHKTKDLRCTVVGKNTDGFELSFTADDGVILEPTFTASAMDNNGVLAKIEYTPAA